MIDFLITKMPLSAALVCLGLSIFVLSRNPKSRVNQSFCLGMAALALVELGEFMALHSYTISSYLFWKKISILGEILLPGPWLVFSLTFGRANPFDYLTRWRAGIVGIHLLSLIFLIQLGMGWFLSDELTLHRPGFWFFVFLLLSLLTILVNFEGTLRSANHMQRERIKYLIIGIGSIFAFIIYVLSQILVFSSVEPDFSLMTSTVVLIGCGLMSYSLARHGLMDVNVYVSRHVFYNSATVIFAAVYLLSVGGLAQAIKSFGGNYDLYLAALFVFLSILILVLLLLSYDLRKRVEIFINRHFYTAKYDYRKKWLELTDRLSSKIDVQDLVLPLSSMIFETFWIKKTVLWLSDEREEEFQLIKTPDSPLSGSLRLDPVLVRLLKERDYPVMLDNLKEDPTLPQFLIGPLKEKFNSLGVSIPVPLVLENRLVGILGLSERHSGGPLTTEDYDLLKTMAKQAASSILNAKLSQRLVSAKELETFHLLSAFLIHDLKNFVSMLSLVVQNMGRNLENPEFRRDALASVSQTVDKMKGLMERLTSFSKELKFSYSPIDLNDLIRETLIEAGKSIRSNVIEDFQKLPVILVDPVQVKKVIRNLMLNAEEAVSVQGEIRLSTSVQDGMVAFSVSDNGCGMTSEFLDQRLFKPFSTTKSQGLGIGLYHSKSIIEAHGGKIHVYSQLGKGSTFTVLMPIDKEQ